MQSSNLTLDFGFFNFQHSKCKDRLMNFAAGHATLQQSPIFVIACKAFAQSINKLKTSRASNNYSQSSARKLMELDESKVQSVA